MAYKLGITGFMGSGKTTVSDILVNQGIPVWDADKSVHKLYKYGGLGYQALTKRYAKLENNVAIDRKQLTTMIKNGEITLQLIEALIHPLLQMEREKFINKKKTEAIIAFDIPLLFQTNAQRWLNSVLVVSCSKATQMKRLLKRPNMSQDKIDVLLDRQNRDLHLMNKYDFSINSEKEFNLMKKDVISVIRIIREKINA